MTIGIQCTRFSPPDVCFASGLSCLIEFIMWQYFAKLHIMQVSSSSGCFLDLRHENPRKSPETTFFPYDNDAICTPTQNICQCYSFTYSIIFILEEDTTGKSWAECDSCYQVTCVMINITCGTDHFHSVAESRLRCKVHGGFKTALNSVQHVGAMLFGMNETGNVLYV
jgi:hypothetical protein